MAQVSLYLEARHWRLANKRPELTWQRALAFLVAFFSLLMAFISELINEPIKAAPLL